ncbi:MAG: glycosyltransferase [Alphaproteobacteria bacterium]|nr:MAG: glycosyltransferase [Alphaproteobacteria bacterium]
MTHGGIGRSGRKRQARVAVVTTLADGERAGGHVRVWKRIGEAFAQLEDRPVDLDLFYLSAPGSSRILCEKPADGLAIHRLPARWPSDRFSFLRTAAGGTDLAPYHPRLARAIADADLVVASDPYAFGRTARRWARRTGRPLCYAMQTRHDRFTEIYAREILDHILPGPLAGLVCDRIDLPGRLAAASRRAIARIHEEAALVFASNEIERRALAGRLAPQRVRLLRRGLDFHRFSPAHRDRSWLEARFGVPKSVPLLVFAGRVDASKGLPLLIETMEVLTRSDGLRTPPHLFIAGDGPWRRTARERLGESVHAPGLLDQETLARVMANGDIFVFPSRSEAAGNVVREAQATGLPVLVPAGEGIAECIAETGRDGIVVAVDHPADWAEAVGRMLEGDADAHKRRRQAVAAAARRRWPTWRQVFEEDLLPAWTTLIETDRKRP